jgi:hypothetical protein
VGDGLESVAVDPSNGKIYVAYESSTRFTKNVKQSVGSWDDEILLVTSSDSGVTWTGPTVIHKLANDMPTFTPTVAVNRGRVAVAYYDSHNLQPGQTANWPTDYWVEYSTDGGATWGRGAAHHGPIRPVDGTGGARVLPRRLRSPTAKRQRLPDCLRQDQLQCAVLVEQPTVRPGEQQHDADHQHKPDRRLQRVTALTSDNFLHSSVLMNLAGAGGEGGHQLGQFARAGGQRLWPRSRDAQRRGPR